MSTTERPRTEETHVEYRHVTPPAAFADMPGELASHARGYVYPDNASLIVRLAPSAS